MFEVTFLIPTVDNEGVPIHEFFIQEWEARARTAFGGYSLLPGLVEGSWESPTGKVYRDKLRQYIVAIPSLSEGLKLARLADAAKELLNQEAVYIRYLGLSEVL
jgi:hypothetical protein